MWNRIRLLPKQVLDHFDRNELQVSVIIPVYNAGEYLALLLDSIIAQDIEPGAMDVIAIDDGSTDGSGDVLDEYATRMRNMTVVHQESSGWPGMPRNRGLELSRARYVFFADADDQFAPEALRRLVTFANRHRSDVVAAKMYGLNGRWVHVSLFSRTQVDANLEIAFRTLSPCKLFRRDLLVEHAIRFPAGKVRLEDGILLARAYLLADQTMTTTGCASATTVGI